MAFETDSATHTTLDYRFGWRWLVPGRSGQRVIACGLTAEEHHWWSQNTAMQVLRSTATRVDGCLVALDHCERSTVADQLRGTPPAWLCAWGSTAAADRARRLLRGTYSVREYAFLPAHHPRVVVPLSSPWRAVAGLSMHRPGRLAARLGLWAARGLARFGHYGLVRQRVLLVATRSLGPPSGGVGNPESAEVQAEQMDYALYLGTPDNNRKTVVLPVGGVPPDVILKVAESSWARAAVQNEAQALRVLAETTLASHVPRLIGTEEANGRLTLAQEYRPRLAVRKQRFSAAVTRFLGGLATIEREQIRLSELLPSLRNHTGGALSAEIESAATQLMARLAALAEEGVQIWQHRSHGDFAPWNCCWTAKGIFVFDWEHSRAHDLALGDAFYFVFCPAMHVQKRLDVKLPLAAALRLAGEAAAEADFGRIDVRRYLAIWLLQRLAHTPILGELTVRLERVWR